MPNAVQISPANSLVQKIRGMSGQIQAALPRVGLTEDRFIRIASTAVRTNPDLLKCEPTTVLCSLLQAAALGVLPNDGLDKSYLVTRYNKHIDGKECQLQIGYRGLKELAKRSGAVDYIAAGTVRQGDNFTYSRTPAAINHEPKFGYRRQPTTATGQKGAADDVLAYYAAAFKGDRCIAVRVLEVADVEDARLRSPAGVKWYGPWHTDYDAMAETTAIRRLCRRDLDLSADDPLARAVVLDEQADQDRTQTFDVAVLEAVHGENGGPVIQGEIVHDAAPDAAPEVVQDKATGEITFG